MYVSVPQPKPGSTILPLTHSKLKKTHPNNKAFGVLGSKKGTWRRGVGARREKRVLAKKKRRIYPQTHNKLG